MRAGRRRSRFEKFDVAFHERLRQAFLDLARRAPERCVVIDATGNEDEVAARSGRPSPDALRSTEPWRRGRPSAGRGDRDRSHRRTCPSARNFCACGAGRGPERAPPGRSAAGAPPQGWLICGPPGVGKATLAYRIARYVLSYGANDEGPADLAVRRTRPGRAAGHGRGASRPAGAEARTQSQTPAR